jgi:hypothetical protein
MTSLLRLPLAGTLPFLGSVRADTVVLPTGESIEGHLLSANEHTVRTQDTRRIEEIPRVRIDLYRHPLSHTTT